jgi:hypothetical protein
MTWFRLPLFIWAMYATSVIIVLGTPVVAITLLLVLVERMLHLGIFSRSLAATRSVPAHVLVLLAPRRLHHDPAFARDHQRAGCGEQQEANLRL